MVSGVEWKDERSFIDMVTKSINKEWSTVDHIILNGFASIFFLRIDLWPRFARLTIVP